MPTSNQTIFSTNRDGIISAAMRKCQALAKGQVPDSFDLSNAQEALNGLIAQYMTKGMQLWKRLELDVALTADKDTYTIGVGQEVNEPYPVRMLQARLTGPTDGSKIDIRILADQDFNLLPKSASGQPVQMNYQPFVNFGVVKLWPAPDDNTKTNRVLSLTYQTPFEYFTASADEPDFPAEWYLALVYGLAVLISPEYGLPLQDRQALILEHQLYLENALDGSGENTSVFIRPSDRGM